MHVLALTVVAALAQGLSDPDTAPTDGPRSAAAEGKPYFSKFGDQILARTERIVLGRIESVSSVPRGELVEVEVARSFKGEHSDDIAVLATRGEFFPGSELLLFLVLFNDGPRYTCFNRISTADQDYEDKEAHLVQQLRVEAVLDEEDRRTLARNLLIENARSPRSWPRRNSLRELAYVLKRYPELIRDSDAEELETIAAASEDAVFQKELRALLQTREP